MAALRDIKRKITAVQKTKQITRAMNMVAAAKLKSAQIRMENFRPYAIKFMDVLSSLALRVDTRAHALLAVRDPRRIRVILMTSDRGLCGSFNTNLIKTAEQFMKAKANEGREVSLIPVGRKARDYFRKKAKVVNAHADVFRKFDMNLSIAIGEDAIPAFVAEEYDELYLIYSEFLNVDKRIDYIYEPSDEVLLDQLLPMYLRVLIYRALLETSAGENGARMVAMDNATSNCEEMVRSLSLKYNKARQQAITMELMDIVGGTEALKAG
jgi:F-type H+-transporting ATPase subunit gamma